MPANHCVPHTDEARKKISSALRGKPRVDKRRPIKVVDGTTLYRCGRCLQFIPYEGFYRTKSTVLGIKNECKKCHCRTSLKSRDKENANFNNRVSEMNRRAKMAGVPGRLTRSDVKSVLAIFDKTCARCSSVEHIELDHVQPLSRGGHNVVTNLQCLCSSCNDHKHTRSFDYRSNAQRVALDSLSFQPTEAR